MTKKDITGWEITKTDWLITVSVLLIRFISAYLGYVSYWFAAIYPLVMLLFGLFINWWKPEFGRKKIKVAMTFSWDLIFGFIK